MDYYSSKSELLSWTNSVLQLHVSRLEQFASGAVYCQLVDAYHLDIVPIFKVNFYAREEYEIILNYKVLQAALTQLKITKDLNVINLAKASTVENLELLQWFYRYLRRQQPLVGYDAKQRRSLSVRGGISDVPVPSCITTSFDVYGRSQDLRYGSSSSSATWGVLGLDAPTTFSASSGGTLRPHSARHSSAHNSAGSVGLRAVLSQVTSRYRQGVVTPTRSGGTAPASEAASDAEGFLTKQSSVSSTGTQTEAETAAVTDSAESALEQGDIAANATDHQQPCVSSSGSSDGFASREGGGRLSTGGGHGGSSGTHSSPPAVTGVRDGSSGSPRSASGTGHVGTSGVCDRSGSDRSNAGGPAVEDVLPRLVEGSGENDGRPAAGAVSKTAHSDGGSQPAAINDVEAEAEAAAAANSADGSGGPAVGIASAMTGTDNADLGLTSSRYTTHSTGGALDPQLDSPSAQPATFMANVEMGGKVHPGKCTTPRLPSTTAALAAAATATDMMEGALDTVRRSSTMLRRSIPGLRRLVDILQLHGDSSSDLVMPSGSTAGVESGALASLVASPDSYTYRGKIRSLQDALQTLLRHTGLLLADVQAHVAARAPGQAGAQKLAMQATTLLRDLRELEGEFALINAAVRALDGSQEDAPTVPPPAATTAGTLLSEEQRSLSSTTQLDACLKAVGLAQFGLVQGIHREIAQITTMFLREEPVNAAADTMDDTAASSTRDNGTASAMMAVVKRTARVFKLGDYTLKQLRNGDVYKGRYVSNKKNGEGVYHFVNADVYEGEFKDDRMDGHGVYTFSHEGRYEGQWHNAVYCGSGTETFAKGSTYHGEYMGGLRNGWGACRFFNGDYYEGQWVKGLRDGRGMQQCTDDSNYVGDYARGKRHGHGIYSFANGDRYVGMYADDLPDGHGVYYFSSGQRYQGQWHRGRKHGWSMYTVENGSRFVGQWTEGKPQWVQPLMEGTDPSTKPLVLPEDMEPTLQETVTNAFEAYHCAQAAAILAESRATEHWEGRGEVQTSIRVAVSGAESAASIAQAARQRAQELSAKLDNAVALLQASTGGLLAGTPLGPTVPVISIGSGDKSSGGGCVPEMVAHVASEQESMAELTY